MESIETARYGELINSSRILRFYLEELREVESLGISMLQLIIAPTARAIEQGKQLIPRIRQELPKVKQQQELLELIETILVYKLPQVSRKEIEAMFSLSDLKQTKVYQEALEEDREEGREEGRQEGELAAKLASIPRLLALVLNFEQIAQALELDIEQVRPATQRE